MSLIWVHALVHLLSPVNVSSDGLNIHLVIVSAALLVLVGKVAYPPIMFTPAFW